MENDTPTLVHEVEEDLTVTTNRELVYGSRVRSDDHFHDDPGFRDDLKWDRERR
jgi:hypothetical protein